MLHDQQFQKIKVENDGMAIGARAYMYSQDGNVLKAAAIVGPEQACVGIFANLVQEGSTLTVDGNHTTKCDFRYRRLVHRLPCRWVCMLILSKDPRCVWVDSDAGLITALKRTTETPFLDEWITYIRKRLLEDQLLSPMSGLNHKGSILACSTEQVDGIVVAGLRAGLLNWKA